MKRLIKKLNINFFDVLIKYDKNNRECAIVYINGEIIEGDEHWNIIKNYFVQNNVDFESPEVMDEIDRFLDGKKSNQEYIKEYATADKINDEDLGETIMVHSGSISGISKNELFNKLEQQYPDYDVLLDNDVTEILNENSATSKLQKLSYHSELNRDYAFLYVDGNCYIDSDHGKCINKFLKQENITLTNGNEYEQLDNRQVAFGHLVGNKLYLMTNLIYNIDMNECINNIKQIYPNYEIYDDDNPKFDENENIYYDKIAKLIKKSYDSSKDQSNFVVPGAPLYPQNYFDQRDPKRLKKIKDMHDRGEYIDFEEITVPTMTKENNLYKINGLAMDKIYKLPGDSIVVYHGTSSAFVDTILSNGLTENIDNSYQNGGASYGGGIWVTLNYNSAKQYATDSTKGFMKDNENNEDPNITQYFNYGAILEIEVTKDSLNDENSASNNNLKSNDIIPPNNIKQIYIFDINSGQTWNYF